MFFVHFIFALLAAAILSAVFALGFRRSGPWSLTVFFIVLFLASWAGGIWFTPVGPVLWGTYWFPFLGVAFIFALLLIALAPRENEQRGAEGETVRLVDRQKQRWRREVLGWTFWLLIAVLVAAIAAFYI